MLRETSLPTDEPEAVDRSMRAVEWGLAFLAVIAAGVLALMR
jgi:hypothetical protein